MQPAVPGRLLGGRYRLLDHLARGGMATVWIGEDTLLARRVAVKTLHPELSADESLRARFRNEAISSASIEDARIVGIYDTGEDDGVAYIVLEFASGHAILPLAADRGRPRPPAPPRAAAVPAPAAPVRECRLGRGPGAAVRARGGPRGGARRRRGRRSPHRPRPPRHPPPPPLATPDRPGPPAA